MMGGDVPACLRPGVWAGWLALRGGNFTTAGGVAANRIARWDDFVVARPGQREGGEYPLVSALAFGPDGSLYAGGSFTTAGGVTANHIARWDGATSSWHPLGSGMNGL